MKNNANHNHSQILILNVGSSSVKYKIFTIPDLNEIKSGKITGIKNNHEHAIKEVFTQIGTNFAAIANRVVHGGQYYSSAVKIDAQVIVNLESLIPFAPLHQPHNINAIKIAAELFPQIPQYACFDTAFHHGHDPIFDTYAIPQNLRDMGLKHYGFHGLSYNYISLNLKENHPNLYNGKIIAAHLGSGASVCGMVGGVSVDSSMGLTALEGLPMGTRSGSIDAGLILYLINHLKMPANEVENILYNKSGLLGLSGLSNDMQELEMANTPQANLTIDFFTLKAAQTIAQMAVSIGGIDALVFTGGIGENSQNIRDKIINKLNFMPQFKTLVINTNEEKVMAMQVRRML